MMEDRGILVLDLNAVPDTPNESSDIKSDAVLGPALPHLDILHMNKDEVVSLTSAKLTGDEINDKRQLYQELQ